MPYPTTPTAPGPASAFGRRAPLLLGLALSVVLAACGGGGEQRSADAAPAAVGAPGADTHAAHASPAASAAGGAEATPQGALVATVYKTPTCGCCQAWVDHLEANGFRVATVDREDLTPIKAEHGVGEHLASCHTALIGGYVVEGHVPAADITRLLRERPAVAGIAVPGMPSGSPGMEMPGAPADRYDVVSFERTGATRVFASH